MSATSYSLILQNSREINATRIKDVLYIFTGTYPVYYKGDGKLYMFPEYQPSFSEQVVAGHNTMISDFEEYYYGRNFKTLPANQIASRPSVIDFEFQPKLPYQIKEDTETDPQIEVRLSYNYRDAYAAGFSGFLPPTYKGVVDTFSNLPASPNVNDFYYINDEKRFYFYDDPDWVRVSTLNVANGFGQYYEIETKVYFRPSSVGSSEADWIEVEDGNFETDVFTNSNPTSRFEIVDGVYEDRKTGNINTTEPLKVTIDNISAGLRDIRVEFIVNRSGYESEYVDTFGQAVRTEQRFVTRKIYSEFVDFDEVDITLFKLENYPTDEEPDRANFKLHAPWSCNNVIEHFGNLLAFGSLKNPETIFVTARENLFYLPANYTIDLNTDLKEPVNSVVPYMNILVAQSDSYTWGIKGSTPQRFFDEFGENQNPAAYQVFSINASVGSIAPKSVRPIRNRLYFLSQEGLMELTSLFATDDRYNVKPIDRNIINLIPQDKKAVGIQFDNQYWINFPSTGETFRYYIDKEAWVRDTVNFDDFNGIYRYYNKDGVLHFITNPMVIEDGNFEIYEGVVDDSLATDFGQIIETEMLTSKMNQDYPFHWKRYKEYKLDFSIQNEYLPRGVIEVNSVDVGAELTFSAPFEKNHTYSVAFENDLDNVQNLNVTNVESFEAKNGLIYFTVGPNPPSEVTIVFDAFTFTTDFTLTDETYDNNLEFDIAVTSNNNALIRGTYVADNFYSEESPQTSNELGIMANTFEDTFGNSKLGKATTFVHTNKLYGSGYDIEMHYKDQAKVKWTLETVGVAYKMRRTRSR